VDAAPDLSLLEKQIGWCRSVACDLVVLALHRGLENELWKRPDQLKMAHSLAESGADVILSHHAHNIQPFELYRPGRDPDRVVPIFYGIGNLSCPMAAPHNVVSLVVNFEIALAELYWGMENYDDALGVLREDLEKIPENVSLREAAIDFHLHAHEVGTLSTIRRS